MTCSTETQRPDKEWQMHFEVTPRNQSISEFSLHYDTSNTNQDTFHKGISSNYEMNRKLIGTVFPAQCNCIYLRYVMQNEFGLSTLVS